MARSFSKLRRAYFRELRPGSKISERGLVATKLTNGDVRWSVNVMVDGHRIHRVVGLESDGVTRLQAEHFIENVKNQRPPAAIAPAERPKIESQF